MAGFIGEKLQQLIDEGGTGGGGGGLPLYRHTIEVYESRGDTFDIFIQLISTSSEEVDTEDKLKSILGEGEFPCICTGLYLYDQLAYQASALRTNGNHYVIIQDENINGRATNLFSTDYDLIIADTVTAIDNASAAVTTLYRHDVRLYDSGGDQFDIYVSILSTTDTEYDTLDSVKNAIGIDKPMMVSGTYNKNEAIEAVSSITVVTDGLLLHYGVDTDDIFYYSDISDFISITDTVRPLASITVNGSGGIDFSEIGQIDFYWGEPVDVETDDGIYWSEIGRIADKNGGSLWEGNIIHRMPLQAGDGIEFVLNEDGNRVVVNATGSGSGIIDIPAQYVRITDLDSGIYRLTYEGTKYIYYSGTSGTNTKSYTFINPIHLYVNKRQATADGTAHWDWYIISSFGTMYTVPSITYGYTSASGGRFEEKGLGSLLTAISSYVKNELTYSTSNTTYALSAYQGYLLDQNKQNKTDETLETTDKTIVGAINELNGKSSIPKLYSPTIKISGLTLTIKNPVKNKDYVASYDIYNVDTNTLIRNTKKTTVDLESFNIADGTYNIAVKAKGIEFNGTPLYGESDYSNVLSYTHDNPPTLAQGGGWYKGTVDKSTITEITFDNTYEVTGNETESWDASKGQDGSVMCYLNGTSITIKPIHSTNKVRANTNCMYLFKDFSGITTINNFTALDTSIVRNMNGMFYQCYALTTLDVSNFDTSSVTNMMNMFASCNALTTLDVSNFDTSSVTNMYGMFGGCNALTTLDVSGFDTSNVTRMGAMFQSCKALTTLDVSGFDTSNVTEMVAMFRSCRSLIMLDLSNFDTSNVTNMYWMFEGCTNLTADCSSWNVDNVTSYTNFNKDAPNVMPPIWVTETSEAIETN